MRRPLLAFVASLATLFFLVRTREARAGVFLGAELDGGVSLGAAGVHAGYGVAGALGYRIGLGPVFLQPEGQGTFMTFPDLVTPLHPVRILGGARLGYLGRIVQPGVYGHAGVGWLASTLDGPSFDAGLVVAFKLVPFFSFGVKGGYDVLTVLSTGQATKWLDVGLHAGLDF